MGPHEARLRALLALYNERGSAMFADPGVVAACRGQGAASGAPVYETYVWAYRFHDGKAVTYAIARDREQALRAAGLAL